MAIKQIIAEDASLLRTLSSTIAKAKRMILVTGAGISTSCGIPDFRSTTGLYNGLDNTTTSPRASTKSLFDANMLRTEDDTARFNTFMGSLRQRVQSAKTKPSTTHRFIKHLSNRGQLQRCYTQNIDGLEQHIGLNDHLDSAKLTKRRKLNPQTSPAALNTSTTQDDADCEVVPLHGRLSMLRCMTCSKTQPFTEVHHTQSFSRGISPTCDACFHSNMLRSLAGRRGATMREGFLRPDIVLYGEEHPEADLIGNIMEHDLFSWGKRGDLLLIMGTSLAVKGVQRLVRELSKAMKARTPTAAKKAETAGRVIFVNNTAPSTSVWGEVIDTWVEMPCDEFVNTLGHHEASLQVPETLASPPRLGTVSPRKPAAIMLDTPSKGHATGLFTPPNSRPTPRPHKRGPADRLSSAKVVCLPTTPKTLRKAITNSTSSDVTLLSPPTSPPKKPTAPLKKRKREFKPYDLFDVDEQKQIIVLEDTSAEEDLESLISTPAVSEIGRGVLAESTGNKRRRIAVASK